MSNFHLTTELHHGDDALDHLTTLAGSTVLVVTDPYMSTTLLMSEVLQLLDGCRTEIFNQVEPNPSVSVVAAATQSLLICQPDVLVAVGGGSSIDTAKAVLKVALDQGQPLRHGLWVVPTTSGSGSEVTSFSVITETETHTKVPLKSPDMTPNVAILDPRAVVTAPPGITADTGMDVATHAIEAYVSRSHSDFSDALAEKSIQLVCTWLPRCHRDGADLEAREHMHNASCLAGMAFENAGLGITHSLAHAIGSHFPVAHGRLNALLLPHTLAFNTQDPDTSRRVGWLGHLVGLPVTGDRARVAAFIRAVRTLNRQLHIGTRITEHGVDGDAYRQAVVGMAEQAMDDACTGQNPLQPSTEDLRQLLLKIV